ncbi:hypothetical protein, partial [Pseudostreptobacillus hongkongensis]
TVTNHKDVGSALSALDKAIENSSKNITELTNKQISFQGNDDSPISKKLGEILKIKGEGTVNGATAKDNIKVTKNDSNDGLNIK